MKAQTQAVSAVMITGIMVGTIAAVYVWGTPLLEKRESQAELNQIENDIVGLKDEIESVSNSGSGSGSEIDVRINTGQVTVNEDQNYIEIITDEHSTYSGNAWTLLEGNNLQGLSIGSGEYGIKGQDTPGVVAATSEADGARAKYRVEFRKLQDERLNDPIMELIDLESIGAETSSGETTISITNQGTETNENEVEIETDAPGGERLDLERTRVRVDLR